MKRNTRKGFTGIELVIVIAIIAILATALIPAFGGLFDSANKTADIQMAKNLNTALLLHNINSEVNDFADVLAAARAEGYLISKLNPTSKGCYLVWESESNQFLLVDAEANFEVLFAADPNYSSDSANWHFVTSDLDAIKQLETAGYSVARAATTTSGLAALVAQGGTQTIYIDESIEMDANNIAFTKEGYDITLNLGESNVSSNGTLDGAPIFAKTAGKLTVIGGTLSCNGMEESEHGSFACSIGYEPGANLVIEGVTFTGITGINGTWKGSGAVQIAVSDSTFDVSKNGVIVAAGSPEGVATITKCHINAGQYAIFGSQGAKITVDGGTYKGGKAVIYSNTTADGASLITINSGEFDGKFEVTNSSNIVINGGTFSNTGLTLEAFKAYVAAGKTVTENADGAYVVQ